MKLWYDSALAYDGGQGGLRILYPVKDGFVEYSFVHSVVPEKNCDIWRMSVVNALDGTGAFLHRLTKSTAEWEMALRLKGRPDFIGGFNHGDERGQAPIFRLDGMEFSPPSLSEPKVFSRLEIFVCSTGFDPASPSEAVLSHQKKYVFDADGVHLEQEVLWSKDAVLCGRFKSYLAMMPPLKHDPKDEQKRLTDSVAFGSSPLQPITRLPVEGERVQRITVSGDAYRFTMEVSDYEPLYPNSYYALLTDNGNHRNYHKMYIAFAGGAEESVSAGTRWHAKTHYRIEKL